MAIELVTTGSNDVRTNLLIGPVLGCLPLIKTSSSEDDVVVCGVFENGDDKLSNFRNYELDTTLLLEWIPVV
jgi:hypothetical protein